MLTGVKKVDPDISTIKIPKILRKRPIDIVLKIENIESEFAQMVEERYGHKISHKNGCKKHTGVPTLENICLACTAEIYAAWRKSKHV